MPPCAPPRCEYWPTRRWRACSSRRSRAGRSYLEAVSSLAWLINNRGIPDGDVRAAQLVAGADTPPSRWPEAAHADGGMARRLAELMEANA
jgi:hypothetical protein